MKTKSIAIIVSGTAVAAACLLGGWFPQTSNAQTESSPATASDDSTAPGAVDSPTALPPGVYPSSPLAQVIKLTQAGVTESVIMSFVNNSGSTFNLDPDKIIFLKDIGAPDDLVTAMMQRDQVLLAQMTASANQPPPEPAPVAEAVASAPAPADPPAPVTVNYFYDTLAPYGSWVDVEGYGRCWRPTVMVVNAGWQPYCDNGHWVYTDAGWYWISNYSWGWAPFHYGRWFHHARFGWCWYPDTVWGPSWVTWRYSNDYCGWAPLPPFTAYASGIGFTYRGAAVSIGFDFGLGASAFIFVPTRNFCDTHPRRYRADSREVAQIYNRTTIINNFHVDSHSRTFMNAGIAPERITAITRKEIRPIAIRETTTPVAHGQQLGRDGRTLMINRPRFAANPPSPKNQGALPHAAPSSPIVGSPYQPAHTGNENINAQPPRHNQALPSTAVPSQRRFPSVITPGAPARSEMTTPADRSPAPLNRYAPVAPVRPTAPNNNSTDNRRYPSPKMQQIEQQNQRVSPGNAGGRAGAPSSGPTGGNHVPPTPQPSQRSYGAPVSTPAPAVQPPATTQPPQHNYGSPRNQMPPTVARPDNSQSRSPGNQPGGVAAPSSPPAQSQKPNKDKNQN